MNPKDLLYTNQFRNTESLSKKQLTENADNFVPYRTLKANSVNNVRDDLERSVFTTNPIVQRENKAYGWNKGGIANQQPVLSDFARDISESTYFRYRTSYLNIDSRMRDVALYPRPNNYKMFLGRKFDNIESIKLIDYFFPDMEYPINLYNNTLMWFIIPYEVIETFPFPFNPVTDFINIYSWRVNLNNFIPIPADRTCDPLMVELRNRILNCIYAIEITPGYYTTTQLEKEIEQKWRNTVFFNTSLFNSIGSASAYVPPEGSPTAEFINKPQLVKVRINPITSQVDFMLRYEEFKIDFMKCYINKNFIDIRIASDDPNVPCEEYNILANNTFYPIIPTELPGIGGIPETFINYKEFTTKNWFEYFRDVFDYFVSYYDIVKDPNTGEPIPNIIRLVLWDVDLDSEKICSSSETFKIDDKCPKLCDALIGREAPMFLIKGKSSPIFNLIRGVGNNPGILDIYDCAECDLKPFLPNCNILSSDVTAILDKYLINTDCSNRLITSILGFLDTENSLAQVGPLNYTFAITINLIYKSNPYIGTVQTAITAYYQGLAFQKCELKNGYECPGPNIEISYKSNSTTLDFKLPICKNDDGTYSFYFTNYMFLKLLNPVLSNQKSGSEIIQVRSTPSFANGSDDKYQFINDEIDGITVSPLGINISPSCENLVPSLVPNKTAGTAILSKDVDNLFAKIKFSSKSGECGVDNPFTNEVIYFEGNVINLDELTIQLVDFQGRILQTNKDHCFTLMLVEKIEVLKDTNINTRTGYVNSSGSDNVIRNNYATS